MTQQSNSKEYFAENFHRYFKIHIQKFDEENMQNKMVARPHLYKNMAKKNANIDAMSKNIHFHNVL